MKAAFIHQVGPAENLTYGDLPQPEPTGRQVLVRTGAVDVNPVDTSVRSGLVQMDLPLPFVVGCDVAGTVAALGPEATRAPVGERGGGGNPGLLGRRGPFAAGAVRGGERLP